MILRIIINLIIANIFAFNSSSAYSSENDDTYSIKLSKNHKRALQIDCKENYKKEFNSVQKCKMALEADIRKKGELINILSFDEYDIADAESNCIRRVKKGIFAYNTCLAKVLDIAMISDPPPVVVEPTPQPEDTPSTFPEENNKQPEKPKKIEDPEILKDADTVYEIISKATYYIEALAESGYGARGTAVAIEKNLLATNCHIIYKSNSITHKITNNSYKYITVINIHDDYKKSENWKPATIYKSDIKNDRCIIKANVNATPVKIKKFEKIKMWEKVFATGNPEGNVGVMTPGSIQSKYPNGWFFEGGNNIRFEFSVPLVQTNAKIRGGSSGGGLYDLNGYLIGITTLGDMDLTKANPMNVAISADQFMKLLKQ